MAKLKSRSKANPAPRNNGPRQKKVAPKAAPSLRGEALQLAVERFQAEPDDKKAQAQWKRIESSVFGVEFDD